MATVVNIVAKFCSVCGAVTVWSITFLNGGRERHTCKVCSTHKDY